MKQLLLMFLIITLTISCSKKIEKQLIFDYKYIGQTNYFPDLKPDLRYDTLNIAFAGNFNRDTINVKYQDIDSTIIMTSDEIDGLACDLRLGAIVDSKLFLKINDYKPVEIIINKDNQLFLIEKYDSILKVRGRYYLPGFY